MEQRPLFSTIIQILEDLKKRLPEELNNTSNTPEEQSQTRYPFDLPDTDDKIVIEEFGRTQQVFAKSATLYKFIERFTLEPFKG